MADTLLVTLEDLVQHLGLFLGGSPYSAAQSAVRDAIATACREVCQRRRWTYYYKTHQIPLVAPQTTGTIEYDHSGGGTCERQLTLSGATWPAWAGQGRVQLGTLVSVVATRHSDTVLELDSAQNPGADLAAGTTYTIFRTEYLLPADFIAGDEFYLEQTPWQAVWVHPSQYAAMERYAFQSGTPTYYTVIGDRQNYGRHALVYWPPTYAAETIQFVYQRRPRDLKLDGLTTRLRTGTITTTAGSAAVTGDATAFASDLRGAVLRVSASKDPPTGASGDNPYLEQRIVSDVTGALALTCDAPLANSQTGVGYTVSDPLDVDPVMVDCIKRCAEYHAGSRKHRADQQRLYQEYERSFVLACEADNRTFAPRQAGRVGWRSPRLAEIGPPGLAAEI